MQIGAVVTTLTPIIVLGTNYHTNEVATKYPQKILTYREGGLFENNYIMSVIRWCHELCDLEECNIILLL